MSRALACLCLLFACNASAQFTQMVSIGDSLSDTGNIDNATIGLFPGSPNYMGRFSNGILWNEALAFELGLNAPTPSRNGGDNYAFGGALTGMDYQEGFWIFTITIPAATSQIFDFLGDVANFPDADALYTLSIGGNDVLEAGDALPVGASQAQIDTAGQDLYNIALSLEVALQQLLDDLPTGGEARLVLMNVPNVGASPRAIAESKQTIYQQLSVAYNQGIDQVVASVDDPRVVLVDFYEISNRIVANPAIYGMTNVTDRCWTESPTTICSNPDEYLFWDDIHPTTMAHSLLALEVLEAMYPPQVLVPLPWFSAALLALLLALVAKSYSLLNRHNLHQESKHVS